MTNALVGPALFAELISYLNTETFLTVKFKPTNRKYYESVLADGAVHKTFKRVDYTGDGSIEDIRQWLNQMEYLAVSTNSSVYIGAGSMGDIEAEFCSTRPYTQEEKDFAADFLANNPDPGPQLIKWRKPVPMINTGYGVIDKKD